MATPSANDRIENLRKELGSNLTILGHHYQADEVIRHVDIKGDSLELARKINDIKSEHIIFCGVYFMAESAALLARPGQKIHLPELTAECSMALMADAKTAENVLRKLTANGRKITPLTYVNSTLAIKSVTGAFGGTVCTSANAEKMLKWAFEQGGDVLFMPDQNLGWNTAPKLGIPELECMEISVEGDGSSFDPSGTEKARLLLWPGYCEVHKFFTPQHVAAARAKYPDARIVVHPESTPDVVKAVDDAGSTSYMIKYVENAKPGETIVIGTEIHLVKRLAEMFAGKVKVVPLAESSCEHMTKVTEDRLAQCIEDVAKGGGSYEVKAPEEYKANARLALDRMLEQMEK